MLIYDWLKEHGIEMKKNPLIEQAFVHSSYSNEHRMGTRNNERLEFMGDAVMQIWTSEKLFRIKPALSEGQMTTMRARAVCEASFASLMRQLDLGQFLMLGVGEEKNGGRNKNSILADCFEAFIGALYLTKGMKAVDMILSPLIDSMFTTPEEAEITDYKTRLQEYVQADIRKAVRYVVLSEEGPSNSPTFQIGVYLDDVLLGRGTGHSKKLAEQAAAREALKILVK